MPRPAARPRLRNNLAGKTLAGRVPKYTGAGEGEESGGTEYGERKREGEKNEEGAGGGREGMEGRDGKTWRGRRWMGRSGWGGRVRSTEEEER